MDWWRPDLCLPVLGAAAAGGCIGFERDYHGHPAGLRTHILVAMTSALLMLAAVHQVGWMQHDVQQQVMRIDPVRMAHGILTGIGFLCGGVIFRNGFSVHGLTTAASLWATSALGTLYGVRMYDLAIGGTIAVILVLAVLRLVDAGMPQWRMATVQVAFPRTAHVQQEEFVALLGQFNLRPQTVSQSLAPGGVVEFEGVCKSRRRINVEGLARRLTDDERVCAFHILPRKH